MEIFSNMVSEKNVADFISDVVSEKKNFPAWCRKNNFFPTWCRNFPLHAISITRSENISNRVEISQLNFQFNKNFNKIFNIP
jgi:hypothetical protein